MSPHAQSAIKALVITKSFPTGMIQKRRTRSHVYLRSLGGHGWLRHRHPGRGRCGDEVGGSDHG
jgi:hypothetical protein